MPVSTDRHSGFSTGKWELKYLRCRYIAHRNKVKIAAAKPAIDAKAPPDRPHVRYKKKKALQEERRQIRVVQENLRILDRTMSIMSSTNEMPTYFSKARSPSTKITRSSQHQPSLETVEESSGKVEKAEDATVTSSSTTLTGKKSRYFDRPLTARMKRNTHIIFQWFVQRFGSYMPWWAEINY